MKPAILRQFAELDIDIVSLNGSHTFVDPKTLAGGFAEGGES